ncbi:MAG: hypothetical protein AAGK00_01840 [Pseudomonadota bacterium]
MPKVRTKKRSLMRFGDFRFGYGLGQSTASIFFALFVLTALGGCAAGISKEPRLPKVVAAPTMPPLFEFEFAQQSTRVKTTVHRVAQGDFAIRVVGDSFDGLGPADGAMARDAAAHVANKITCRQIEDNVQINVGRYIAPDTVAVFDAPPNSWLFRVSCIRTAS